MLLKTLNLNFLKLLGSKFAIIVLGHYKKFLVPFPGKTQLLLNMSFFAID